MKSELIDNTSSTIQKSYQFNVGIWKQNLRLMAQLKNTKLNQKA
jgi:hypothetical protein